MIILPTYLITYLTPSIFFIHPPFISVSHQCGGSSSESLSSFHSPNYPLASKGTLACDFELRIQKDVCAVRVEYVHVRLFGKLGGVCDVDHILILNSVDGPTSSQCGDLSGYTSMYFNQLHSKESIAPS